MESGINILPEQLINKIAAGEVVQSPAAVVKELVENALDAGASRITVVVTHGGKELIKVVDNGHGMTPEEARMSLRRHATSKITSMDDLRNVKTMGFRGEALPSIASVSKFFMTTRPSDTQEAVKLSVSEGNVNIEPAAHPPGTSIEVRDLFFNVPARKKFVKSDRYEGSKIQQTIMHYAFARLDCHFLLFKDERKVYDLPPVDSLTARAMQIFGSKIGRSIYPVEFDGMLTRVWGFISDPVLARAHTDRMLLFVNNRPVNDHGLRRAVLSAYGPLIARGRFPTSVIHLQMPPELVDVNCHPQKTEVKFAGPSKVFESTYSAVRHVVETTPWLKQGGGYQVDIPTDPITRNGYSQATDNPVPDQGRFGNSLNLQAMHSLFEAPPDYPRPENDRQAKAFENFVDLRYIGQLGRVILVFEGRQSVVLIDQHAAHEKVNYERLKKEVMSGKAVSQPLLFPQKMPLLPEEMKIFDDMQDRFRQVGFEITVGNDDSLIIGAVPQILAKRDAGTAIQEMLGMHKQGRKDLDLIIATTACHASIRAGDQVDPTEVTTLMQDMDRTATSGYCPHGRQAVVTIPMEKMLRWFGR